MFLSFDIETSGAAGIVQMSAEAVRLQLGQGTSAGKDVATSVSRVPMTFNKCVCNARSQSARNAGKGGMISTAQYEV